ncbi:Glyoxalase/bleomycin resistance protein/dioxygenase [Actinokineospora spheciospongiae]|uniref:Glyoxalase/bleomycin resistance protein/dioxygenase n=1 Tax=Actinokineospora spheciospongiae TaxID=909613 RepID=W7IBV9_9PSEU|nr:VOC family protein [Actinokineospora spheciospongiae]EWC58270.1 Glyoxalase/bleomycin resistance protein/dioxygenase [Actinokineospora spheciospongiae]PWW58467.1 putative enzyme related to lactoylglutathione lyase [Actinokineospora spheciospongiae]
MTASLAMVSLDCPDPQALAVFYSELLGWKVAHSEEQYAMITGEGAPIGFGRVEGYVAPQWSADSPDAKRYHLDFYVDDLDAAEARALELGAAKPEFQPGETWRVLLDPAGHPFCLCVPRG